MARYVTIIVAVIALTTGQTNAQFDSGSDGSDGALIATSNVLVDLSLAASLCDCDGGVVLDDPCRWDCPSPVSGQGVYDAENWAVVFKYSSVNIGAAQVKFANHRSGAPVVWLVENDVVLAISAFIGLEGTAATGEFSVPAPGGFEGGRGGPSTVEGVGPSGGLGPGGGRGIGSAGSHATLGVGGFQTYGNEASLPLIGGSGGAGTATNAKGSSGGGAILIAASGDIQLDGQISAIAVAGQGGAGSGSGGAIRLVANNVLGAGTLRAQGGPSNRTGGFGRIRVEAAQTIDLSDLGIPFWTSSTPGPIFSPVGSPTLRAISVNAAPVPADPDAGILTPDVELATDQPATIIIEATNIPVGTTVQVLAVPEHGNGVINVSVSTPLADAGGGLLTATASVNLPVGHTEIQLKANWTP